MRKAIGINQFLAKEFVTLPFEGKWRDSFGQPEHNFTMCVYGESGQGKSSFCMALAKYLCQFRSGYYNTFEEGISKTMQDSLIRYNMHEVAGKLVFGDQESVPEMHERLGRPRSPGFCIIDSRDYLNLTSVQFKKLRDSHPKKIIVVICWAKNGLPKGDYAKAIEYMCDIKVRVHAGVAEVRSRFGGNADFVIFRKQRKHAPGTLFSQFSTSLNASNER